MKVRFDTPLDNVVPVQKKQKNALENLGIETVGDILYHFPTRFVTRENITRAKNVKDGAEVVLYGHLKNLQTKKSYRKNIPMATADFVDDTGKLSVVWFHQPYIAEMVDENQPVKLTGKAKEKDDRLSITNPEYKKLEKLPDTGPLFSQNNNDEVFILPIYSRSSGVSSKWIYHTIKKLLAKKSLLDSLKDPLPETLRERLNLPDIKKALVWIHTPKKKAHAKIAQKRFAFEEVFAVQIIKKQARHKFNKQESFPIKATYDDLEDFLDRFDFTPTDAQKRSIKEILEDFRTDRAMSRLLEGDVGSGKTFVAAATAYASVTTPPKGREFGHLQAAYMAPTEILARQQFESFVDYFAHLPIEMALITGSGCRKFPSKIDDTKATDISKNQLLKWIKEGVVSIVIGTHSLIQNEIQFENLAYVIIDEQHRFGVNQRQKLVKKEGPLPHLLSMTATPIPRTLALTIYGDLDLSVIDEMPPGRKTADTKLVKETERDKTYDFLRKKLKNGEQAYVICPRIDKPDPDDDSALDVMSVEAMEEKMKQTFPDFTVDILHGQMKNKDKERVMDEFADGKADILVSTSVVEVGVNVPNATTIIIENAERFGLAQLHQLRGRVQRSQAQAHCFLFANIQTEKTRRRLKALETANDGFELAEKDLEIRGPGAMVGARQSGMADIAMEALENIDLVEAAGSAASDIIQKDPDLKKHPKIRERTTRLEKSAHFE